MTWSGWRRRSALPCSGAVSRRPSTWTTARLLPGAWLLRGCAVLGIKLIHSRPGKPEGRGKIERFFRTVRDQFLVEIGDGSGVADLAQMNRLFQAWAETVYHQTVHSETGEEPIARWARAAPAERAVPDPGRLREAFLWSERRRVSKTALVSLHGNSYQVGAWLAGRYVELVFDPFDLSHAEVRAGGKPAGTAVPFTIGRHRHPKTRTGDGQPRTEPAPTGINYLAALGDDWDTGLKDQVSYRSLTSAGQQEEKEKGESHE
jgi:putative transposase